MKEEVRGRAMTRDIIKYLAVICMTLNHAAYALLPDGGILRELLIHIGYFTGPVMLFFLTEGFAYTRNRKKYALRLLAAGLLAQPPFAYCFHSGLANMMFTLLLCFLMIWGLAECRNAFLRFLLVAVSVFLSAYCDWALMAPGITLGFLWAGKDRRKMLLPFGMAAVGVLSPVPLLAWAAIAFGYNGKQEENHRNFHKWFFYAYYPAHLAVLALVKYLLVS